MKTYKAITRVLNLSLIIMFIAFSLTEAKDSTIVIEGMVKRNKEFRANLPNNLLFSLIPSTDGWNIEIKCKSDSGKANFADITPPYRGPSALLISGWHFRNNKNTSTNSGELNYPGNERHFIFALEKSDHLLFWKAIRCGLQGSDSYDTCENGYSKDNYQSRFNSIPKDSALFKINKFKLSNLKEGKKAWIDQMEFELTIWHKIHLKE